METSTHGGSSENAADIVHFEDPKLEELILNTEQFGYKIDANEDGVLTKEEMSHLHGLNASGMGITSLEGIQYAGHEAGNSIFDFSDNAITDLTPIAELYAAHPDAFFQTIDLRNNQISDFSALFGMSMNRLNGLAIAGNPAPADHYFTLWGTPDEIFLGTKGSGYSGCHLAILYHFGGDGNIDETHGIDYIPADDDMLYMGIAGDYVGVYAKEKSGDTILYAEHEGVRKEVTVHIGSADLSADDVIAQDMVLEAEPGTVENLMNLIGPDEALWTVQGYEWTSSDPAVAEVYEGPNSFWIPDWRVGINGYGTTTITGTPGQYVEQDRVIELTITVQEPTTIPEEEIVHFADETLQRLVAAEVDENQDGIVTKEEMQDLYVLDASDMGITSLEGMQFAKPSADASFDFSGNEISDFSPIQDLMTSGLVFIDLSDNQITDFSSLYGEGGRLRRVSLEGNPAEDEAYLKLFSFPQSVYLKATEDPSAYEEHTFAELAYTYQGADIAQTLGLTFESEEEDIAYVQKNGISWIVRSGAQCGETTVYAVHGETKLPIRVVVGRADAQPGDIVAEDVVIKADLGTRQELMDFLKPADALWSVSDYTWHSSDDAIVSVEQDDAGVWYVVYHGYGTVEITGTPKTRTEAETINFTLTVERAEEGESGPNDPQDPDTEEPERGDSPDTAAAADAGSLMCMLAGGMGAAVLQRRKHSR